MVADTYQITVAGRTFLVGSERGEAHVRNVVDYVEQRLRDVAHHMPTVDLTRISLMTAITLAEELLDLSAFDHGSR